MISDEEKNTKKNYLLILKSLECLLKESKEYKLFSAEQDLKRALLLIRSGVNKIEHAKTKRIN